MSWNLADYEYEQLPKLEKNLLELKPNDCAPFLPDEILRVLTDIA